MVICKLHIHRVLGKVSNLQGVVSMLGTGLAVKAAPGNFSGAETV
jgi:hypothetical protein